MSTALEDDLRAARNEIERLRAERDAKEDGMLREMARAAKAEAALKVVLVLLREAAQAIVSLRAHANRQQHRAITAERYEAVCGCGQPVRSHDAFNDGHMGVAMPEECPYERDLWEAIRHPIAWLFLGGKRWQAEARIEENRRAR